MKAFVARFLDVRAGLMKGNTHYEAGVIKMALTSILSTHGKCSCFSPHAFRYSLSSKGCEGAHIICWHTEISVSICICVVGPKQIIN